MENEKTFEQKIVELQEVKTGYQFNPEIVAPESIDQLIKAHELKYIENILEVEEENKLVVENIDDFLAYNENIQRAAMITYEDVKRDPEYFNLSKYPGHNIALYKPCMIIANIENKKNEAKIKTWRVEYHTRLIGELSSFRFFVGKKSVKNQPSILSLVLNLFTRAKQ
jgi:hypothetical protein